MKGFKWRQLGSNIVNLFSAAGSAIFYLLSYYIKNWEYLTLYVALIPNCLLFSLTYFIEESPLYLFTKDRKKVVKVLNNIAKINKKPSLSHEFQRKLFTLESQLEEQKSKSKVEKPQQKGRKKAVLDITNDTNLS